MSELRDFTEFSNKLLVFPYQGKKYTQPVLTIEAGFRLGGILDGTDKVALKKMKGADLYRLACGPLWDEMVADGVPLAFATRVAVTILADNQHGRSYAEAVWEAGLDPKRLAAYMEAATETTPTPANRAQRRSSSTGGVTKTPSRASSKATTSRKS